jgi:CRISPR-associated protein Csm1
LNPKSEEDYLKFVETHHSTRFVFYGGNKQVTKKDGSDDLADLESIAQPADGKTLNKIAVVKMDVDGLGTVFREPKGDYGTLPAMSDLSARVDWFFTGYLNQLREDKRFKDTVNIIYAGGDDLCAIGRWDAVLTFASQVREDFRAYIGNVDGLTISAGYSLFTPKFPISKAIKEANENLDKAKGFINVFPDKTFKKDAINLLGISVNWQTTDKAHQEWQFIQDLTKQFIAWLADGTISKSTIYKLFVFKKNKDDGELDYRWQSAFYFAKMKKPELLPFRDAMITDNLITPSVSGHFPKRMFDLIIIAAKLADYHSR